MNDQLKTIIEQYDPNLELDLASTIPSSWYIDKGFYNHELQTVFSQSWQLAARADQLTEPGKYVTTDIAGEPVVIVRGNDGELRGFFNVCRHHAAAVMTEPEGKAAQLRCPYHGWTYSLEGELKGTPDFSGVCDFDRATNGLVSLEIASPWTSFTNTQFSHSAISRDTRPLVARSKSHTPEKSGVPFSSPSSE